MQAPSDANLARHLDQDGGKARGPCRLLRGRLDQVVAQLNKHVGPLMGDGMARDGIAGQVSAIRLVVADAKVRLLAQTRQQRAGKSRVGGIEQPDMPGPWRAALELRGKAVD